MPALKPTDFTARVTFLGAVADRAARLGSGSLDEINATFAGFSGEAHSGLTRASDSRVRFQYELGTEIRNTRQFSILSGEELAEIAADMGVTKVDPRWLGASMVLEGFDDFSHIPPSSRLQFSSGATLVVDMQNRPCVLPAREIDRAQAGLGKLFKPAAEGRRGVTAWVEREGMIRVGDVVRLHIPDQPRWRHQPG
jgi:MOSC domain-containing protein